MEMGNSRPIPELYEIASIKFDFSKEYLGGIIDFVKKELDSLDAGL